MFGLRAQAAKYRSDAGAERCTDITQSSGKNKKLPEKLDVTKLFHLYFLLLSF